MTGQQTRGDRLTAHQDQPSAGQLVAAVVGTMYLVAGLLGFLVTGSSDFTGFDPAHNLAGFTVNPLQNVLHLLLGGLGIGAFASAGLARLYGVVVFVAFGVLFVWGATAGGGSNALNLDHGGNVLHGFTSLIGAFTAVLPVGRNRADSSQGER
jgi:hypothetical protein